VYGVEVGCTGSGESLRRRFLFSWGKGAWNYVQSVKFKCTYVQVPMLLRFPGNSHVSYLGRYSCALASLVLGKSGIPRCDAMQCHLSLVPDTSIQTYDTNESVPAFRLPQTLVAHAAIAMFWSTKLDTFGISWAREQKHAGR
jgi:hypothetical protein